MQDPIPNTAPMVAQTIDDVRRDRELAAVRKTLAQHDAVRAKAPKITLVCTAPFTLVTDENPEGIVIERGQEFEISEFDLPRYLGRGFPKTGSSVPDSLGLRGPTVE